MTHPETPSSDAQPAAPDAESLRTIAPELGTVAHEVVNAVSARLSDELIVQSRTWNRDGRLVDTARSIAFALLRTGISTDESVALMLGSLLGSDTGAEEQQRAEISDIVDALLNNSEPGADQSDTPFTFAPGSDNPTSIAAITERATAEPAVLAAWRAERRPMIDAPWPPPRDVYVIETANDADPVQLTADFQEALAIAGNSLPLVEVRRVDAIPNEYQRRIVNDGDLVWTRQPRVELQVADVYDEVLDDVGVFRSGRAVIPPDDRNRLTAYLLAASVVIDTADWIDDVIDPNVGAVVPTSIRTDGTWVWSDATTYYLSEHGIAPAPPLLAHIQAAQSSPSPLDSDTMRRAANVIYAFSSTDTRENLTETA